MQRGTKSPCIKEERLPAATRIWGDNVNNNHHSICNQLVFGRILYVLKIYPFHIRHLHFLMDWFTENTGGLYEQHKDQHGKYNGV